MARFKYFILMVLAAVFGIKTASPSITPQPPTGSPAVTRRENEYPASPHGHDSDKSSVAPHSVEARVEPPRALDDGGDASIVQSLADTARRAWASAAKFLRLPN